MSGSSLLLSLLLGSVGFGYFVYGKRQRAAMPLVCGLVLMVFPYFISNSFLLVAIGVGLMALPFLVRS